MENRKSAGLDGINLEVLKYGSTVFKFRLLHLLNICVLGDAGFRISGE